MDKMREAFLEKFLVPRYGRVIAEGYARRLDTPDTLWVQQDCWEAWQAAQSAESVPVGANGMLEKFKLWKDERIGRSALIEPLEWFAGGYTCAQTDKREAVPVDAAELERLRKDAERYQNIRMNTELSILVGHTEAGYDRSLYGDDIDAYADAAIAGEKK